jgi:Tfp pilus assembly protein PilF
MEREPDIVIKPGAPTRQSRSRMHASSAMTQEGQRLLKKGDLDGAIRILEKAVGVNPRDGQGYYFLAEAWIGKKNFKLAQQFNKLAGIYLREDVNWYQRAMDQKKTIDARM